MTHTTEKHDEKHNEKHGDKDEKPTLFAHPLRVVGLVVLVLCVALATALIIWYSAVERIITTQDLQGLKSIEGAFDVTKYCKVWNEVARVPSFFEPRDMVNVTATYTLQPDGKVTVLNQGKINDVPQIANGIALPTNIAGVFSVSFFPFISSLYTIIDLQIDALGTYTRAVVTTPERRLFWVLSSNSTTLTESDKTEITAILKTNGISDEILANAQWFLA